MYCVGLCHVLCMFVLRIVYVCVMHCAGSCCICLYYVFYMSLCYVLCMLVLCIVYVCVLAFIMGLLRVIGDVKDDSVGDSPTSTTAEVGEIACAPEESMCRVARVIYASTMGKYHSWVVKKAAALAILTLGTRTQMFNQVDEAIDDFSMCVHMCIYARCVWFVFNLCLISLFTLSVCFPSA